MRRCWISCACESHVGAAQRRVGALPLQGLGDPRRDDAAASIERTVLTAALARGERGYRRAGPSASSQRRVTVENAK
jgi:hypothetical protein